MSSSRIDIHLLTSAYDILRSDAKREAYDRELADSRRRTRPSGSDTYTAPTPPPPLARTTLSLSDFTPHYESELVASLEEAEEEIDSDDDDPTHYTHPCRCGFEFLIRREDLEEGVDVVGCDGCGDWVGVGYEVVEDETDHGEA